MTTPSGITPDGATPGGTLLGSQTFGSYQNKTQADWQSAQNGQWSSAFSNTFNFGSFIQGLPQLVVVAMLQMLAGLLDMVPIVGTILADIVLQIANGINSTNSTANSANSTANNTAGALPTVKSGTPLWSGIDSTAEVSLPYSNTLTTFAITQGASRGAFLRLQGGDEKRVITWMGSGNTSITHFYIDIYKMDIVTGNLTLVHQSPDFAASLIGTAAWHQYSIATGTDGYLSSKGDVIYVSLRLVGSGTHTVYGKSLTAATALAGVYPTKMGGVHDGTASTTSAATMTQSFVGSVDDVPFIEVATDHGQDDILKTFSDNFERADGGLGANWVSRNTSGSNLTIVSQAVRYNGTTDGAQSALWLYPMTTDKVYSEVLLTSMGGGTGQACIFICSDNTMSNICALKINSSTIKIATGSYSSLTDRASLSVTNASGSTYSLEYDPVTNVFAVHKDGSTSPVLTWTDSTNIVTHGVGHRFVGMDLNRVPFNSCGEIGLWSAKDVL